MSSRETVIEYVRKLPDEMSLAEIAREIELLAGLQTAREQARRREGIPAEDARKLVDAWAYHQLSCSVQLGSRPRSWSICRSFSTGWFNVVR